MHTVASIAKHIGGRVDGNGDIQIESVAGLKEALCGDLSFLANPRYRPLVAKTKASAVIVDDAFDGTCHAALIRCENPGEAFTAAAILFAPPEHIVTPGIHPSAIIGDEVTLGEDVHIGPFVVIEDGATIGDNTVLWGQNFIGANCRIGEHCVLYPQVTMREECIIGERVILHNGVVIGSDGFGYGVDEKGRRVKHRQSGIVVIGNDVEIGANTTVDRARFGRTIIGNGVKIDNLVQVAHNVVIGDDTVIVAQAGVAGSCVLGEKILVGGQAGLAGHIVIGDKASIGAQAGVTKDVAPNTYVLGFPATPFEKYSKARGHIAQLPRLKDRLENLEARLRQLESGASGAS